MSTEQCKVLMHELRLHGMRKEFEVQISDTSLQSIGFTSRLARLLETQRNERDNKKLETMIRNAKFRVNASPEDINYGSVRNLNREVMENLLTCDWIENGQHVFITGATGTGKTWLACALGQQAVRRVNRTFYVRFPRFIEDIEIAYRDGGLPKFRNKLFKTSLLIIDDWGLSPITERSRQELLEIIDERSNRGSLIIASQLPVKQWHEYIGEATVSDAIMDRLIYNSHNIELKGESMRKQKLSSLNPN